MIITEIEYQNFLTYGKYFPHLYDKYCLTNQKLQEIEENKSVIEKWIKEDYVNQILTQIKWTKFTRKRMIPSELYLDFLKLTRFGYKLEYVLTDK